MEQTIPEIVDAVLVSAVMVVRMVSVGHPDPTKEWWAEFYTALALAALKQYDLLV